MMAQEQSNWYNYLCTYVATCSSVSVIVLGKHKHIKAKGICLRVQISMTKHVLQALSFPWQARCQSSLQLLNLTPWIWAPGTHYIWVDCSSVECKVCLILLHMTRVTSDK